MKRAGDQLEPNNNKNPKLVSEHIIQYNEKLFKAYNLVNKMYPPENIELDNALSEIRVFLISRLHYWHQKIDGYMTINEIINLGNFLADIETMASIKTDPKVTAFVTNQPLKQSYPRVIQYFETEENQDNNNNAIKSMFEEVEEDIGYSNSDLDLPVLEPYGKTQVSSSNFYDDDYSCDEADCENRWQNRL